MLFTGTDVLGYINTTLQKKEVQGLGVHAAEVLDSNDLLMGGRVVLGKIIRQVGFPTLLVYNEVALLDAVVNQ